MTVNHDSGHLNQQDRDREYIAALQRALLGCGEIAGADISNAPMGRELAVWALRAVEQLRKDYDEGLTEWKILDLDGT